VQHVNPRIPNYRLEECHDADARFRSASTLTLRTGLQALAYTLWDSDLERRVPFSLCRRRLGDGWIAAEMMVRSTARFSRLVLVAPLGIKLRGRDERDIADMRGIERTEYLRLAWAEPAKGEADYTALPDTELAAIVRGREAFALYGWKLYMHNPRLKRWLHRIDRPTLLPWGVQDGIVTPSYGDGLRQEIPDARIDIIPGCVQG
jgi:pimeloyl-ACP methyl ester carboxylesterase